MFIHSGALKPQLQVVNKQGAFLCSDGGEIETGFNINSIISSKEFPSLVYLYSYLRRSDTTFLVEVRLVTSNNQD